jgi:hypothetical protein
MIGLPLAAFPGACFAEAAVGPGVVGRHRLDQDDYPNPVTVVAGRRRGPSSPPCSGAFRGSG